MHSDDLERAGLSRRSVLKTAAWATPTIVLATAVPAAAASGDPVYDLSVAITGFSEARNWTNTTTHGAGNDAYAGPGYVTWTATITNNGPDPVPIGTLIEFGMGSGRYMSIPDVAMDGADLPFSSDYEETGDSARHWWQYLTPAEIPVDDTVTFQLHGFLNSIPDSDYGLPQLTNNANSAWEWAVYNINVFVRAYDSDGTAHQDNAAQRIAFYVNDKVTAVPPPVIPNTTYTPLPTA